MEILIPIKIQKTKTCHRKHPGLTILTHGSLWAPRVVLNTSPLSYANYVQGSGTTTLTFASLIAQEVYQPSLDVTSIDLNGGTIADINSNTASISLSYAIANNTTLVDLTNIRLDSKNPILSSYTVSDTNNLAPVATASVGDGDVVTYYFNSDN